MNRRQFLQRLLEKNDYRHEYVNFNHNPEYGYDSPPSMVKRMQIMQLGCARIGAPAIKKAQQNQRTYERNQPNTNLADQPVNMKNNANTNSNNKRVFVLQRVKHQKKKKQNQKQQNSFSTANTPLLKNNSDIAKEINVCIAKERFSMENINISPKTPFLDNTKEPHHFKTCSESPNRWGAFKKKYNASKNDQLRGSEILTRTKEESNQCRNPEEKTDRSQAKSMYMKPNQFPNYSSALHGSSSPTKRQASLFRKKYSNSALRDKVVVSDRNPQKQQKNNKMMLRKQIHRTYNKQFAPPPKISAKSFIVIEKNGNKLSLEQRNMKNTLTPKNAQQNSHKVHLSFNSKSAVQVASLTKIMTCLVALQLCMKYSLDPKNQVIKIGKYESNIGGTSARIQDGDIYTLYDLLFGLMLPSGNDASLAIAVWGGKVIFGNGDTSSANSNLQMLNSEKTNNKKVTKKTQYFNRFILQMNRKAKQLQMTKTNYANSHGLINTMNKSCAYDIAMLSIYAMENQQFRKIVGTKKYEIVINHEQKVPKKISETTISTATRNKNTIQNGRVHWKSQSPTKKTVVEKKEEEKGYYSDEEQIEDSFQNNSEDEDQLSLVQEEVTIQPIQPQFDIVTTSRNVCWENTHRLLQKPNSKYIGIKTGVTTAAGPCLSSCVRTQCGRQFYIVVLNCKKMLLRFKQTDLLRKWVFKQENLLQIKEKSLRNGANSVKTYSCLGSEVEQEEFDEDDYANED